MSIRRSLSVLGATAFVAVGTLGIAVPANAAPPPKGVSYWISSNGADAIAVKRKGSTLYIANPLVSCQRAIKAGSGGMYLASGMNQGGSWSQEFLRVNRKNKRLRLEHSSSSTTLTYRKANLKRVNQTYSGNANLRKEIRSCNSINWPTLAPV